MGRPYSKAQGGSAIVVAASDTPGVLKSRADLVCVGTSTTGGDDVYINNALGRADAVILCPGTFWVSGSITLGTGQSLFGCGPSSVIKARNSHNAGLLVIINSDTVGGNNNIAVQNLKVDGNKANQTAGWAYGITFQRVGVGNTPGGKIIGCIIENLYSGLGILVSQSDSNILLGNSIRECLVAITLEGAKNNVLVGNCCQTNRAHGVALSSSSGNTVVGNTCQWNRGYGFFLENTSSYNIISGNTAHGNGFEGICIDNSSNNTVSNNSFIENSQQGDNLRDNIWVEANDQYNLISGNFCRAPSVATTLSGAHSAGATVLTLANASGFVIGGGITIDADNGSGKKETRRISNISGNVVTIETGLANDQADGEDVAKPRAAYGVNIAANTCISNMAINNDIYESGKTSNLRDVGTNTIIRNNRGYNPVGISTITVGASPFTYTAAASPETVYVSGGTVSSITKGGNNFGLTSGSFNLEPHESIIVTYTVAPTMYKDVH